MSAVWVETYRPQVLEDIVGNEAAIGSLKGLLARSDLPHLILTGPPGVGKTTAALAFVKSFLPGEFFKKGFLELNSSDDRGVDIVRERIKTFARDMVNLPEGKVKVILLDEADSMTIGAQQALRRIMEKYAATTRFIFSCNTSSKIIPALQSRCAVVCFTQLSESQIQNRLIAISEAEGLHFDRPGLQTIVVASGGDLRKAVGLLQAVGVSCGDVNSDTASEVCSVPPVHEMTRYIALCGAGRFSLAHQFIDELLRKGYSTTDILKTLKSCIAKVSKDIEIQHLLTEALFDSQSPLSASPVPLLTFDVLTLEFIHILAR